MAPSVPSRLRDRKSTRLNSSHTVIYTLSLHDALPICVTGFGDGQVVALTSWIVHQKPKLSLDGAFGALKTQRSEEHTSELQSHSDLHSFPTRRSSDLCDRFWRRPGSRAHLLDSSSKAQAES